MSEPIISLRAVGFGYRTDVPVVSGITTDLWRGRLTVLLGPNAAGKSTLLRLMLGHLPPDAGAVLIEGRRASDMQAGERALRVAYVPQRGGVSFAFSVREVVDMGRFARGRDDAAVAAAMAECEVDELAARPFTELSGGQQQRVLVARAMAQVDAGGAAMLLDEPGSSMDLRHQHALMARLRGEAAKGLAVLIVLHDVNLAAAYADEVWLMDAGRLVARGPWQEVLGVERLEPIYGVGLRSFENDGRPVFIVEPRDTLTHTRR